MKLTIESAISIHAGLKLLDSYERVIKDGERERVVSEFYKFGGGLRLLIAKNLNHLDVVVSTFQKARDGLVYEFSVDGKAEVPSEKMAAFGKAVRDLMDTEEEIELSKIKGDELKLDENPVPASTLSLLLPILD